MDNLNDDKIKKIFELAKPTYNLTDDYVKQTLTIKELGTTTEVEIPNSSTLTHTSIITSRRTRGGGTQTETIIIYYYCPVELSLTEKIKIGRALENIPKITNTLKKTILNLETLQVSKSNKVTIKQRIDVDGNPIKDDDDNIIYQSTKKGTDSYDVYPDPENESTTDLFYYYVYGASKKVSKIEKPLYVYVQPKKFTPELHTAGLLWTALNTPQPLCTTGNNSFDITFLNGEKDTFVDTKIPWEDIDVPEAFSKLFIRPEASKCIFHKDSTIQSLQRIYYNRYMTMMGNGGILPAFYFDIEGKIKIYPHIGEIYKEFSDEEIYEDIYKDYAYVNQIYSGDTLAVQGTLELCQPIDPEDMGECVKTGGVCRGGKLFVGYLYSNIYRRYTVSYTFSIDEGGNEVPNGILLFLSTRIGGDAGFNFFRRLNYNSHTFEQDAQTGSRPIPPPSEFGAFNELQSFESALSYYIEEYELEEAPGELASCTGCGGMDPKGPSTPKLNDPDSGSLLPIFKYDWKYHHWFIRLVFLSDPEVIPLWENLKEKYTDISDEMLFSDYVTPVMEVYVRNKAKKDEVYVEETEEEFIKRLWTLSTSTP